MYYASAESSHTGPLCTLHCWETGVWEIGKGVKLQQQHLHALADMTQQEA